MGVHLVLAVVVVVLAASVVRVSVLRAALVCQTDEGGIVRISVRLVLGRVVLVVACVRVSVVCVPRLVGVAARLGVRVVVGAAVILVRVNRFDRVVRVMQLARVSLHVFMAVRVNVIVRGVLHVAFVLRF